MYHHDNTTMYMLQDQRIATASHISSTYHGPVRHQTPFPVIRQMGHRRMIQVYETTKPENMVKRSYSNCSGAYYIPRLNKRRPGLAATGVGGGVPKMEYFCAAQRSNVNQ